MRFSRRDFQRMALGLAALPLAAPGLGETNFPMRPIRLIVGFPAGSGPDIVARIIGQGMSSSAWPIRRRREPAGRRQQSWHQRRRARPAGRLHADDADQRANVDQPDALQESQLRSAARHRAGRQHRR